MSADLLSHGMLSSLALVGTLGFRHGFDADHIAAVDGMTRARQLHHGYWTSRRVGLQFALGHSAVILLVSLLLHGQRAMMPGWLDGLGKVISTSFLLVIAFFNLRHACRPAAAPQVASSPFGEVLSRLIGNNLHPAWVGAAFAVSLDSLAQAAFFASRGSESGGLGTVLVMGVAFGLGMTLADAANGALLNWFAGRSDRLARQASRFSSAFVAVIALATVAAGMLREFDAGFARVWENAGMWIGVGLLSFTSLVYVARLSYQRRAGRALPQVGSAA